MICQKAAFFNEDPRQTTYRTHYEAKYKKYAGGKIINFVQENIPEMNIDSTTLSTSSRNNQIICNLANKMYPDMEPCDSAMNVKTEHDGIFWIEEKDIDNYMETYKPMQLRYDRRTKTANANVAVRKIKRTERRKPFKVLCGSYQSKV